MVDGRADIPIVIVPSFDDKLNGMLDDNEGDLASGLVQNQPIN